MEAIVEASSSVGFDTGVNSVVHTVKCGVPQIDNLETLCSGTDNDDIIEQIKAWVNLNPDTEHIYKFEIQKGTSTYNNPDDMSGAGSWFKNCLRSLQSNESMNCVVAGSYALWTLAEMIFHCRDVGWKANDIDIFLLGRAQHARRGSGDKGGLLDIVHTTDKTPVEVITNFDIPCCRVAFDMNYTFYVSIHALYSIFTKKVMLPEYLKTSDGFMRVLDRYQLDVPSKIGTSGSRVIVDYHKRLIARMDERIKKYQSRGFSFQWYSTDYILPWIKQRFAYVDFDLMKEPPKKEKNLLEEKIAQKWNVIHAVESIIKQDPSNKQLYTQALKKHHLELTKLLQSQQKPVPLNKAVDVVRCDGYYKTVDNGFILRSQDHAVVGIEVNGRIRELTFEEMQKAISLGFNIATYITSVSNKGKEEEDVVHTCP